jgi:hypothetical protein
MCLENPEKRQFFVFIAYERLPCNAEHPRKSPAMAGLGLFRRNEFQLTLAMAETTASMLPSFKAATQMRPESTP